RLFCPEETEYMVAEGLPIHRADRFRAWVSIMYGCNNFCSYCIVPYVRGRERSRTPSAVIEEVRTLVEQGYREITLLGQNVNSYGKDLGSNYDFADLLQELDTIPGDYRLQFMTSHPKDATRKLIDVMAASEHVAHRFHLPLQSGSDRILKAMNRKYHTEQYLETVSYLRAKMPDVVITSDIIVGFPGETEEDFEGTMQMLETVRFDMIFSFIYSPRKGTPAADMEDQIPKEIQSARFDRLLAVQKDISLAANLPLIGKELRVLCDGVSKHNDALYSGRTEGGKIVFFEAEPQDEGKFLTVKIEEADPFSMRGTVLRSCFFD
ncbi:MAG: tRNA (N6-isopentenyl adenosine(37)-C2)-methylthiotransferase MiaB, partial [Clostridia bacterium]|nr:tRNA (N6-isopentenyl adenosine(37)-C2)-methylthiotransferase MiaB [Clostridia bacterium]